MRIILYIWFAFLFSLSRKLCTERILYFKFGSKKFTIVILWGVLLVDRLWLLVDRLRGRPIDRLWRAVDESLGRGALVVVVVVGVDHLVIPLVAGGAVGGGRGGAI